MMEGPLREARELKALGRFAEAMKVRQELERHYLLDSDPVAVAKNLNQLAYLAAGCGERAEAVRAAEKCLAIYRHVPTIRDETLATYLMMLACTLAEAERFPEAVLCGEDALYIFVRNHGDQSEFVQHRARDIECMRNGEVREYLERT